MYCGVSSDFMPLPLIVEHNSPDICPFFVGKIRETRSMIDALNGVVGNEQTQRNASETTSENTKVEISSHC